LLTVAIVFGVCGLAPLAIGGQSLDLNTLAFVILLPYSLFRWGSGREIMIGSGIVLAKLGLSVLLGYGSLTETLAGVAILSAAAALGSALRYRASSRMRELDRVKLLERERLARDLHDTVAHHVSAMAIRAQAGLATAASQPEAATDALRLIEAEASRALVEMRGIVRVLRRDDPADLTPSPRIGDLQRLAGQSRGGPLVDVDITGDVEDLSPSVITTIHRLAQESVTNALRHARHATRLTVSVEADQTSIRLQVSDDGEVSGLRPAWSPGYGLTGMSERAVLLGGSCQAGPNADRGWTVTAVLPRAAAGR
jgi:signal transduction histidine kinase